MTEDRIGAYLSGLVRVMFNERTYERFLPLACLMLEILLMMASTSEMGRLIIATER